MIFIALQTILSDLKVKKQPKIIHIPCNITTNFSTLNQERIFNSSEPVEIS